MADVGCDPALRRRQPPEDDWQRDRLYAAERDVARLYGGFRLADVSACQAFADRVVASPWTRAAMPSLPRRVLVKDGRGSSAARADAGAIHLPRWARFHLLILHELAHCATPGDRHGPVFAGALVALCRQFIGPESGKQLRSAFRQHGVRFARLDRSGKGLYYLGRRRSLNARPDGNTAEERQDQRHVLRHPGLWRCVCHGQIQAGNRGPLWPGVRVQDLHRQGAYLRARPVHRRAGGGWQG